MKKKIILLLVTVITCVALVFGFTACDNENTDIPSDGNMLTTVFEAWKDDETKSFFLVNRYVTGGAGWTNEKVSGYSIEDLASDKLSYNNYSEFIFKWSTRKYKITKIEFDVVAEKALKTIFCLYNPNEKDSVREEVVVAAGETKHVALSCSFQKNTDIFRIYNKTSEDVKGTISWKLKNLYITAEKV